MDHVNILMRVGKAVWSGVAWLFGRRLDDSDERQSRKDARLDVARMQATLFAMYDRQDAKLRETESKVSSLETRVDVTESKLEECEEDRADLHVKCDSLKAQHEECEVKQQRLSAEIQILKQKLPE